MSERRIVLGLVSILCLVLVVIGCARTTQPDLDTQDLSRIDPDAGELVLKSIPIDTSEGLVYIDLVGRNLRSAGDDTLMLDVALRNTGRLPIFAPITVSLHDFDPESIRVLNSELVPLALPIPGAESLVGFIYDSELPGGVLESGSTSESKTWIFLDPDLAAFAFDADLFSTLMPGSATISGRFHTDLNPDGHHGADDPFGPGLIVTVTDPWGREFYSWPDHMSTYRVPVSMAGLHEVRVDNLSMAPCSPEVISANPLFVMITENPDSTLNSYEGADFEVYNPCVYPIPSIIPTDLTPEALAEEDWDFVSAELAGPILNLQVGYSGCEPTGHDFRLYACGSFMESEPVQIRLALVHGTAEACDAWFMSEPLSFHLGPLIDMFNRMYPHSDTIRMQLVDFEGVHHEIVLTVPPEWPPDLD